MRGQSARFVGGREGHDRVAPAGQARAVRKEKPAQTRTSGRVFEGVMSGSETAGHGIISWRSYAAEWSSCERRASSPLSSSQSLPSSPPSGALPACERSSCAPPACVRWSSERLPSWQPSGEPPACERSSCAPPASARSSSGRLSSCEQPSSCERPSSCVRSSCERRASSPLSSSQSSPSSQPSYEPPAFS
jgi:hypothetical protein